jgi:hypothetical protein
MGWRRKNMERMQRSVRERNKLGIDGGGPLMVLFLREGDRELEKKLKNWRD